MDVVKFKLINLCFMIQKLCDLENSAHGRISLELVQFLQGDVLETFIEKTNII